MGNWKKNSIISKEITGEMAESLWDESWTRNHQRNRLVLMVKDPACLFAYWEVNDLRKRLICEHFQSDWLNLPFYLQLYEVTNIQFNGYNANSVQRIQVHPLCDNWYVQGVQPGRRYQADFGTLTLQGQFFAIIRSNLAETPANLNEKFTEPSVGFRSLHQVTLSEPNNDWQQQFDGYHLYEGEGGFS